MVVRSCRRCGSRLAGDNENEWCSPCLALRRDYDPRTDPHFIVALLWCLKERPGERVDPVKALGIKSEYGRTVKHGIRTLRQQGFVIQAAGERCTGYKFMGFVERQTRERAPAR